MPVDKLKLRMGRPILLNKENSIYVHHPLFSDIVDMGEDDYNMLVYPYVITTEFIFNGVDNEDELIKQFDIFDLFFIEIEEGKMLLDNVLGGKNSIEALTSSLSYFLKTDNIKVLKHRQKIVVNDSYLIDKDEFKNIRRVVQAVCNRTDIEFEKVPKNMSKRKRDIWEKLQKGRQRRAKRNAIYLQDIVNYISFGGKSFIPTREIDSMTYYEFQNAYKSILGIDSYSASMGYKLSYKFDVKEDIKHWTETIKIGK